MATNPEEEMSDLFDQIDDLLDLLEEEEEEVENALVMVKKPCNETGAFLLPPLTPPPPPPPPPVMSAAAAGDEILESSSHQKQFDEQLDYWTPAFLDECGTFLADIELPGAAAGIAKINAFFRDSSPISILVPAANCSGESSSSSSHSSTSASHSGGRSFSARARSNRRRRRPAAFCLPPPHSHSANESFGEFESSPAPKKKKKIKFTMKSPAAGPKDETGSPPPAAAVRKCAHCGTQKTPQWRAGPTGPKTLCNACGVRYKTGRLFPEYRPAASPTFIPALHSNSHKKVVEMRIKAVAEAAGSSSSGTGPDDGCDLLQYIRRRH